MKKYIELVIGIAGLILSFIPENNYLKIIALLGAAVIAALIRVFKLENENKILKNVEHKKITEKHNEIDSKMLKEIRAMLYESQTIEFMRVHDFGGPFFSDVISPLDDYLHKSDNDPEFEFLDSDLNDLKKELDQNIRALLDTLHNDTFKLDANPTLNAVPKEWRRENPDRFNEVVKNANHHATKLVEIYNELVQVARNKMIDL